MESLKVGDLVRIENQTLRVARLRAFGTSHSVVLDHPEELDGGAQVAVFGAEKVAAVAAAKI